MNKERYNSLDLLKYIFSLVVIAIHAQPISSSINPFLYSVYDIFCDLAVPVFFMTTGFLVYKKTMVKGTSAVMHAIKSNIKFYIQCRLLYLPLEMIEHAQNGKSFIYNVLIYLRGFFITGGYYSSTVFWFILSAIYSLIFIYYLLKKNYSITKITVCCMIMTTFGYLCKEYVDCIQVHFPLIQKIISTTISTGRIFNGFAYVAFGMLIANKEVRKIEGLLLFIIGFVLCLLAPDLLKKYTLMVCAIGLFVCALNVKLPDSEIFGFLRLSSKINYVFHYCTLKFLNLFYDNNVVKFILTVIICFVISVIVSMYKRKKVMINV